jgi:hypothetical protein
MPARSSINKHRIPEFVIEELEDNLGVQSLTYLKEGELKKICDKINGGLLDLYDDNKNNVADFIQPDKNKNGNREFFAVKSLQRYIQGHNIRTDKLKALLAFLNYDVARMDAIIFHKTASEEYSVMSLIQGHWNLYIYDSAEPTVHKVKRHPMSLTYRKDNTFKVRLDNLWGRDFGGTAFLSGRSLLLELYTEKEKLFISADLPEMENKTPSDDLILTCAYLSNAHKNATSFGNIILNKVTGSDVTDDAMHIRHFNNKAPRLSFNKNHAYDDASIALKNEKLIINFLSANNHKDNKADAISPNSFIQLGIKIDEMDKDEGLLGYEKLKAKLNLNNHIFYSFNRSRLSHDEVAVFKYTFEFADEEKRCKVKRFKLGHGFQPEFSGEAFLEGEKIYIELKGNNIQRRKQLIAPLESYPEKNHYDTSQSLRGFILKGITSSVSVNDHRHMALRELMICVDLANEKLLNFTAEDKAREFISYKAFCSIDKNIIRDEEKLFLANHAFSTLSFPSQSDARFLHTGQDKARKYHGHYTVLIKNFHTVVLLKLHLHIDEMAQAWLQMKYDNNKNSDTYNYHGFCEYYNANLHVGLHVSATHPSDQKHAEFIFDFIKDIRRKPPEIFTGQNLNTDDDNNAYSSRFIAINNLLIQKMFPAFNTEPGILTKKEMENVNVVLKKVLKHKPVEEYFASE